MLLAIYPKIAFYCTSDALDQIFWPHFELSLSLSLSLSLKEMMNTLKGYKKRK